MNGPHEGTFDLDRGGRGARGGLAAGQLPVGRAGTRGGAGAGGGRRREWHPGEIMGSGSGTPTDWYDEDPYHHRRSPSPTYTNNMNLYSSSSSSHENASSYHYHHQHHQRNDTLHDNSESDSDYYHYSYQNQSPSPGVEFCAQHPYAVVVSNNNTPSRMRMPSSAIVDTASKKPPPSPPPKPVYIRIAPGLTARLRRVAETHNAIVQDFYIPTSCVACSTNLFCIMDANYVLCPLCRCVGRLEGGADLEYDGGVAIGFTWEYLQQIMMGSNGNGSSGNASRGGRGRGRNTGGGPYNGFS